MAIAAGREKKFRESAQIRKKRNQNKMRKNE
jgi:hypothetical protein